MIYLLLGLLITGIVFVYFRTTEGAIFLVIMWTVFLIYRSGIDGYIAEGEGNACEWFDPSSGRTCYSYLPLGDTCSSQIRECEPWKLVGVTTTPPEAIEGCYACLSYQEPSECYISSLSDAKCNSGFLKAKLRR